MDNSYGDAIQDAFSKLAGHVLTSDLHETFNLPSAGAVSVAEADAAGFATIVFETAKHMRPGKVTPKMAETLASALQLPGFETRVESLRYDVLTGERLANDAKGSALECPRITVVVPDTLETVQALRLRAKEMATAKAERHIAKAAYAAHAELEASGLDPNRVLGDIYVKLARSARAMQR